MYEGIYIAEVVFIAYMGLKEAPVQGALGFVPLVVTMIFHYILVRNIIKPLRNLSLEVAANVDIDSAEPSPVKGDGGGATSEGKIYGQPALDATKDERGPMPYRREATPEEPEYEGTGV